MLPKLTVNRTFMTTFAAMKGPCIALGMVELDCQPHAMIALRLPQPVPRHVIAGGMEFGHSLRYGSTWEVVHLAFQFRGFATYNALVNPSKPVARSVLTAMIEAGRYFVFALDSASSTTAFRAGLGRDTAVALRANLARVQGSTTTDAQYRGAIQHFTAYPDPPGRLLHWVCHDLDSALVRPEDRLALQPA